MFQKLDYNKIQTFNVMWNMNHGIIKVGKELCDHLVQPLADHQSHAMR